MSEGVRVRWRTAKALGLALLVYLLVRPRPFARIDGRTVEVLGQAWSASMRAALGPHPCEAVFPLTGPGNIVVRCSLERAHGGAYHVNHSGSIVWTDEDRSFLLAQIGLTTR